MRKIFIYIILICLTFSNSLNVFAYSNEKYEIDIPNGYTKDKTLDVWKCEKENNITTIAIQVVDNSSNMDINNMNQSMLDESLTRKLNKNFEKYQNTMTIKTSLVELVNISTYKSIKMNVEATSKKDKEDFESHVYQTQYIMSSKKYLYYVVISSSKKEFLSTAEISNILNSFTIKDELEVHSKKEIKKYYMTLSVMVLSGFIIAFALKRTRDL